MSKYGTFIDNELKPAIFENLNRLFPEMQFTSFRGGWRSSLALNGRKPNSYRQDKCIVTPKMPNLILEQGGEAIEVVEYYRQRNNLSDRNEAIKAISNILNLTPPPMAESPEYSIYRERQDRLISLVSTMQRELFSDLKAAQALNYLREGRGYSDEIIKGMGFGWCSKDTAAALREICKEGAIPSAPNYVAIPYISSGTIKGVIFRNTSKEGTKYLDAFVSKEATKKYSLFGLTGVALKGRKEDREIVVVEGEIDALRAQYAGLDNVVGAAGKNLSQEALSEAKRMGVERVILLLDYDRGQDKSEDIKRALSSIKAAGLTGLVASFPEDGDKVDTDSYLASHTAEELKGVINSEATFFGCEWELRNIVYPYSVQAGKEELTAQEIDRLRREVAKFYYRDLQRWEQDYLLPKMPDYTAGTLTAEAVKEELHRIEEEDKERLQREKASALVKDAQELISKGDTASALTMIRERAGEIQEITQRAAYGKYMQLPTPESVLAGLRAKKGGIPTGYSFRGKFREEEWEIPTGALTYICAPTSHGKSRLLQNLALSFANNGREGSVLYISLEEDTDAVIERLINIRANIPLNKGTKNNSRTIREYYGENIDFVAKDAKPKLDAAYKDIEGLLTSGRLRLLSRRENREIGYIEELSGFIKYAVEQERVQAVFIDYVQEIYSRCAKGGRKEELMDICNTLMEVSVGTGLPIVLAAQLNREASSPLDMSVQNIADASNIEHSANSVLLLWDSVVPPVSGKDNSYSYYSTKGGVKERKLTPEAEALEGRGFKIGEAGSLYAILAKNRLGERNMDAVLKYDGNTGIVKRNKPEEPTTQALPFMDDDVFLN